MVGDLQRMPDEERLTLEYRLLSPQGVRRLMRDELRVVPGGEGRPPRILGLVLDRSREQALRDQVAALEARIWQSQRLESVGALAGGVAHDFNNLLTAILTTANLLRTDPALPEALAGDLEVIEAAARRGSGLVRQILDFSARTPYEGRPLDLHEIAAGMGPILRRTLGEDLEVRVGGTDTLPPIRGDAAQIEQVILNLAVNAREVMPEGGRLEIETISEVIRTSLATETGSLESGPYVRLTVRDTGPGIDAATRKRIFDPFFTTKGQGEGGAGLGLSTVRRLVRGMGGGIRIESVVGRGTAFHVYLPVRTDTGAEVTAPEPPVEPASLRPLRILVVEDDPEIRRLLERVLRQDGHTVASAETAAEGLETFDRIRPPFELLVTDVVLPDRPGPALHEALQRRVEGLPAVYTSGYDEETVRRRSGDAVGAVFLPKPFTADGARRAVARAMARAEGSDGERTRAKGA